MSKQFIQPKGVSFLNYAIFFDKGSFVFDFIKGVLFFKILNSRKSAFFPGRILFQTSPDKWPGGGVGEDERVKKEALHDKGSFIFQKTEKTNTTKHRNKTLIFWWFSIPEREKLFWKIWETLWWFVLFCPFLRCVRKSSVQKENGFCFDKGSFFFQNL